MLGLGLGLNKNTNKRQIVRNGLVLYLDGRDFKNSPPTSLWMDRSGLGNNATPTGFAYTTASGSDGVSGVVFDGVDDIATVTNNVNFDFGSGDFTIAFSVNMNVKNVINSIVCKRYSATSNASFYIYLGTTTIVFAYSVNGTVSSEITFTKTLNVNTKYRILFRRVGTSLKCFVDNILISETSMGTNVIFTSTENMIMGALNSSGTKSYFLNGTILNLLTYKGKGLTDSEIARDYNVMR